MGSGIVEAIIANCCDYQGDRGGGVMEMEERLDDNLKCFCCTFV